MTKSGHCIGDPNCWRFLSNWLFYSIWWDELPTMFGTASSLYFFATVPLPPLVVVCVSVVCGADCLLSTPHGPVKNVDMHAYSGSSHYIISNSEGDTPFTNTLHVALLFSYLISPCSKSDQSSSTKEYFSSYTRKTSALKRGTSLTP